MIEYGTTGIYCIRNKVSRRLYIGAAKDIRKRWNSHMHALRHKTEFANEDLQADFDKYGEDIFELMLLEECPEHKLFERERFYIDSYGGTNSTMLYNCHMDKKRRERMSEAMMGNQNGAGVEFTDGRKAKIGAANSIALKGHKQSDETKKLRSEKMKQYWADKKAGRR